MSRLLLTSLCFALVLLHAPARGQSSGARFLPTARDVLRLAPPGAGSSLQNARLSGVVLAVDEAGNTFQLNDGTGTLRIGVARGTGLVMPERGAKVRVEGTTASHRLLGGLQIKLNAYKIDLDGKAPLPKGEPLSLATLNTFSHIDQWVSVEGFVMEWSFRRPLLYVKLIERNAWNTAVVRLSDDTQIPKNLHGARVRVTGISGGTRTLVNALDVPDVAHLEFLSPGVADVFDVPLVSIADVMHRKIEPGKRVRVQGTYITTFQKQKVILQGTGGAMTCQLLQPESRQPGVEVTRGDAGLLPELKPGDQIELEGSIFESVVASVKACGLNFCHVRVTGKGEVPKPESVEIETLLGYRNEDHWVTIEGTGEAWTLQGNIMYFAIAGPRASIVFTVYDWPPNFFTTKMHGARIRFTGVSWSLNQTGRGSDFAVPGHMRLDFRKPGTEDPFNAPVHSAADIANDRAPPGERVKAKGVFVGRSRDGQVIYVRGADAALSVQLRRPWPRQSSPSGNFYADFGPWTEMKIGHEVEVVGTSIHNESPEYAPYDLTNAGVRVLRHIDGIEASEAPLNSLSDGGRTSDLVKTRGRLLAVHQVPQPGGEWRTTMMVEAGGKKLPVIYQGTSELPSDLLKIDDELLVQGVMLRAIGKEPRQLMMLSATGVKSLGLSPVVRARQLWLWGGGAFVVFSLFASWIVALRKSNRDKTEIAAMLEQRVNERTAALSKAQDDLSKALGQERELGELKSRFVSMVSHEFRTPLGITMSAIELIRHYDDRLPAEKRHELQMDIFSATRHMAELMEQVLLIGRVEAGKLAFKAASCDVEILACKLIDESLSATNRRCPIIWRADNDLSGAQADEALLRHIFGNLITNGIKYSPEGSEVIFSARREGTDVVFQVSDSGIGIPEEDRQRLFEAFHRCSNVGEIPGTGLGLVIVKRCVDLHGGSLDIDSTVGKGTTFTVRLPLFTASPSPGA